MIENDRYATYKPVPAGFDILNAPPGRHDDYGIPPKPDAITDPQLFAFWKKLVSAPFSSKAPTFSSPYSSTMTVMRSASRRSARQSNPVPTGRGALESSLNWSGAVISPPSPKRFVFVVGGWVAPNVTPASAPALMTHSNDHKSLVWVGIDGHNGRLPKISLPQIGTAHWPGEPQFAWWDWWKHGANSHISKIDDFTITPGDEILAGLAVQVTEDVLYFIKNQSTGEFRSFLAKRQFLGDIEPLGSTAEWVMERPTDPTSLKLYPLPAYDPVEFKYCLALAAVRPLAPGRLTTLADNGRMIKMRESFANPYRTVYVSRAKRRHDPDGSIGVTCTFQEPT
jgi:hypothetical protein